MGEMNSRHSVFKEFEKVFIFHNSGWDSLVSCESSSIDLDGTHCRVTMDHCDRNRNNVVDLNMLSLATNSSNGEFQRVPICLKRSHFENFMGHAILSVTAIP